MLDDEAYQKIINEVDPKTPDEWAELAKILMSMYRLSHKDNANHTSKKNSTTSHNKELQYFDKEIIVKNIVPDNLDKEVIVKNIVPEKQVVKTEKYCPQCKNVKPINEFYRYVKDNGKVIYSGYCKSCNVNKLRVYNERRNKMAHQISGDKNAGSNGGSQ